MSENPLVKEEVVVDEIFFNCPKCGKSLSIDARGEGYVVACPDCRTEVQVPTARIIAALDMDLSTRLRDTFKHHPAWGKLLNEKAGLCGFCLEVTDQTAG